MSTQVKLRGGTSKEHENFVGAQREVTVDTTLNSLRVHDGVTIGGNLLATSKDLSDFIDNVNDTLDEFGNNISSSHNHDELYSKLEHTHNEHPKKPSDSIGIFGKALSGYIGLITESLDETSYIRSPKNGLLPYQSGGYSNIGATSWRFANGYFVNLDILSELKVSSGKVSMGDNDNIQFNDTTNEYSFISDGNVNNSTLVGGCVKLNGHKVYVNSAFPDDASVGDILIQI